MASRYDTILKIAAGGMATVHVGAVRGAHGFRQLVAIKKPHPHLLADASYRAELIAEARLASMIRHANVVDVRDVEGDGDAIVLVMDYIEGASLGDLLVAASQAGKLVPPRVVVRIMLDALAGLGAAHDLVDERGRAVGLVHRDISPQNILLGTDGIARVTDFGVAKFKRKNNESSDGSLKGKVAYMAPEYLRGEKIDRRFDIFATGVVLWEALASRRLFRGDSEADTMRRVLEVTPDRLPDLTALEAVIDTALAKDRERRFVDATAMASALESSASAAGLLGNHGEVAACVKDLCGASIEERRKLVRSQLAHEPSFGSLMGVSGIDSSTGPDTVVDAPSTIPDAENKGTTLPSAIAEAATTTVDVKDAPAIPMRTLASAEPADTQLSFQDPSAHAVPIRRPTKWIAPAVAALVSMVVASAAILFAVSRTTPATGAPSPAPEPVVIPAASAPAAQMPAPEPTPPAAPSASSKKLPTKSTARPPVVAPPAASPAGPKKPPANPYASEQTAP